MKRLTIHLIIPLLLYVLAVSGCADIVQNSSSSNSQIPAMSEAGEQLSNQMRNDNQYIVLYKSQLNAVANNFAAQQTMQGQEKKSSRSDIMVVRQPNVAPHLLLLMSLAFY